MNRRPSSLRIGGREFVWGSRTYVMGIINATPDSFSGDGLTDPQAAADRARRMAEDGAHLIDIGAESTRPGHDPVTADQEWARLAPVLRAVRDAVDLPLTVDTVKPAVAARAFDCGADALNDTSGLRAGGLRTGAEMAALLASSGLPAVVMHNQRGRDFSGDVMVDVRRGLEASIEVAEHAGVPRERLILDPGFGFGWEAPESLEMLRRLGELRALGLPLLIGTSRKSAIGAVLELPERERRWGTAATVALTVQAGADIVRVHDVREMAQAARVADAVVRGWPAGEP